MTKVKFIEADGTEYDVDATDGISLMEAAISNNVLGIIAECGGHLSCSTCHGYIDPAWVGRLDPPSEDETTMIDCTLDPQPNSRLTCQVRITPDMDGLVVRFPASQI